MRISIIEEETLMPFDARKLKLMSFSSRGVKENLCEFRGLSNECGLYFGKKNHWLFRKKDDESVGKLLTIFRTIKNYVTALAISSQTQ